VAAASELLLGLDIGTSSSKGCLARPDGEIVATAQRPHTVSRPRPGWVEQDAEEVWWGDVQALCSELLEHAGDDKIAGVCASGLGPCVVAADKRGRPLRPAILYGVDTRATAEIAELTERFGADEILSRCGSPLSTQAVGPKLLWLRRHEPEVWERTVLFLTAASFLVKRLTGEYVLDHHTASQSDPLYELDRNRWIPEWAEEIAPGLELPRLLWPWELAGEVSDEAAEATGIPAGTPVAAGTMDTWAEAASVGLRRPGDTMIMYATTMFLIEVLTEARPHPHLWSTASLEPGRHNLAGGMATSGALAAWVSELAGGVSHEQLTEEAEAAPRGADGLVVLPYFSGERSPLFDPRARGLICGLTLNHGRAHLYRAVLEGTAYGARHILEEMAEAGGGVRRGVAVGGGTRGGLWTQIVSDVTAIPRQDVPRVTIGASYGDALFAARAVGLAQHDTSWNEAEETIEPDPEAAATYDELYATYRELYPATSEQMHRLADLQIGDLH
jgi:xylulokinase